MKINTKSTALYNSKTIVDETEVRLTHDPSWTVRIQDFTSDTRAWSSLDLHGADADQKVGATLFDETSLSGRAFASVAIGDVTLFLSPATFAALQDAVNDPHEA